MRKWYPLVLIALAFVAGIVAYPRMPERVPVHWNLQGEVDRLGSPAEAAFLMPLVALGMWALLRFLPRIDPRRENYARFQDTYDFVVNVIVTMLVGIHLLVLATALGAPIPLERVLPAVVGVLVMLIGNRLPRARPNWWFGIRTPWTLSNDRVWERTHRVGGYVMMLAGAIILVSGFVPISAFPLVAGVVGGGAALFVVAYSYVAWRQEQEAK